MGFKNYILKRIAKYRPITVESNFIKEGTEFSGRKAIVFGGGTGIGLAITQELVNNGADVVVCGRSRRNIEKVESEVIDVAEIEKLSAKLDAIIKKHNHIDIVVNSQGILTETDYKLDFYGVMPKDFENVIKVNLESVFFINQYFCKYFEENHIKGNILNICSTEGLRGNVVPYGMSKSAVINMTKGIGKRMASKNIVVNGIAPGGTATSMIKIDENEDIRLNYIPSQRACLPLEVGKVAHFLLADTGKQMCGQVVVIDGGESLL